MPSPFPGMDPYLENPRLWRSAHNTLIAMLMAQLNATLPSGFSATSEERIYVQPPDVLFYPDIVTRQEIILPVTRRPGNVSRGGAVAEATVAVPITMPRRVRVAQTQEREQFVEVQSDASGEVVAVIEVLSPANKSNAGNGREEYLRKQRRLMQSAVHPLEIDLLRAGIHTVAVPKSTVSGQDGVTAPYLACLHPGGQFGAAHTIDYWLMPLRDRLPVVGLPLVEGFSDVPIDLQAAFAQMYDAGPFARRVDYGVSPEPSLSSGDTAWADELLRGAGLR